MSRFVFGPAIDGLVSEGPVGGIGSDGAPVKSDVLPVYQGRRGGGLFDFEVPGHDLATFNRLLAIHAVFIAEGHASPATPELAMGPDYTHFTAPYTPALTPAEPAAQADTVVTVDATAIAKGRWVGLAVLEFES